MSAAAAVSAPALAARRGHLNDLTTLLPPELTELRAFLTWRYEAPRAPGAKPPKVPYYVDGGKRCGTLGAPQDLARLATLADAQTAAELDGADGVGFALAGNNGTATLLDFDDCRTADGALIDNPAGRMAQRCIEAGCYWEPSPSGTGMHVIAAFADIGGPRERAPGIELFETVGYITLTGECPPELRGRPLQPLPADVVAELRQLQGGGADGVPLGNVVPWGTREEIAARAARAAAGGPYRPRNGEGATGILAPARRRATGRAGGFRPREPRHVGLGCAAHRRPAEGAGVR
jgi:hypothetical protein